MKKLLISGLAALILAVGAGPAGSADAAPYCGITWGSLPKTATDRGAGEMVKNVRTGQHSCYDRMVVDLSAAHKSGYDVRYVSSVVADGSGAVIPLSGGAKLQIVVKSPAYDSSYNPTYGGVTGKPLPGVNLDGYKTFRDAKFAGSFEGQTTVGLGVRARLPFRAFLLDNRVVVDVAHYW